LYFGDQKADDDRATFNSLLDTLEEELLTNQRTHEHESVYKKYYDIRTTPVRGTTIIPKQDAITEIEKLWLLCPYVE